jgi:hypothetical protein
MENRYELTDKGRAYLQKGHMCKKEHDYLPVFTDKVNGQAIIILTCKKCGESKEVYRYVGEQNRPTPPAM